MTEYVAGFMFLESAQTITQVLLIRKNRPTWQAGRWNGIGGHVEDGESINEAMRREFREEVGIDYLCWEKFASLQVGQSARVHFFKAVVDIVTFISFKSMTDEVVDSFRIKQMPENIIPNLSWLIPMALSPKRLDGVVTPYVIYE